MTWKAFHFSGLLGCGQCDTRTRWLAIRASYARHWPQRDLLLDRCEPGTSNFGMADRFSGETLGEWALRNSVDLSSI